MGEGEVQRYQRVIRFRVPLEAAYRCMNQRGSWMPLDRLHGSSFDISMVLLLDRLHGSSFDISFAENQLNQGVSYVATLHSVGI